MKLKKINCLARSFEYYLDVQPCLQSLHVNLDSYFRIGGIEPGVLYPRLPSQPTLISLELGLRCSTQSKQLWSLYPMMPALRRVKLLIEDVDTVRLKYRGSDWFDVVFLAFEPCLETLETLEIVPVNNERTFYKDVYCAIPSLSRFTKLSKLVIPFRQAFDDLHSILQPLLRELTLLHPGPVQASDLAHIINHYIAYWNLRRLDLYCALDDNVVLSNRAWVAFKEHGILVFVWAISGNRLLKEMSAA